jgi:carbon monoxide dehydrogenase subunit G
MSRGWCPDAIGRLECRLIGYVQRMARFESTSVSEADVPAPREKIWAVVTSPDCLAQLTPLIKRITADGDRWCWQLKSISALGMHVEPSFTEYMSFEEGRRITFEHRPPPGNTERAGAKGTYTLADRLDGGTHLAVDITLHVELPLPAVSRRLVERVMESMMARTGDRFAGNLYARLGIVGGSVPTRVRAGR